MNTYFTQNRRQSSFSVEQQMNDNSSEAAAATELHAFVLSSHPHTQWLELHECVFHSFAFCSRFKRANFLEMVKNSFFFFGAGNDNGIRLIFAEVTDK